MFLLVELSYNRTIRMYFWSDGSSSYVINLKNVCLFFCLTKPQFDTRLGKKHSHSFVAYWFLFPKWDHRASLCQVIAFVIRKFALKKMRSLGVDKLRGKYSSFSSLLGFLCKVKSRSFKFEIMKRILWRFVDFGLKLHTCD